MTRTILMKDRAPNKRRLRIRLSLESKSLKRAMESAIPIVQAYMTYHSIQAFTFEMNGYPQLIVINPQLMRNRKDFLETAKHEWCHAKNGGSEKSAKRAEHRP